jgi:hypothetical protein
MDALPDKRRYPVELWLTHQHRHGEPAEEHIRAQVAMDAAPKGGVAFVDMPVEFWERLPTYPVRVRNAVANKLIRAESGYGRWGSVCGYNPCGEPAFQECLRQQIEKHKEPELSPDARKTLAQVFKQHGAEWTYDALGHYYLSLDDIQRLKPSWKDDRQLAAACRLGHIFQTYTRNAIYDAAADIKKSAVFGDILFSALATIRISS